MFSENQLVVVNRVDSLRGRIKYPNVFNNQDVLNRKPPRFGKFLGVENVRNPYAGLGREQPRMLRAKVELEPYTQYLIRNGVEESTIPKSFFLYEEKKNSMVVYTKVEYLQNV